MRLLALFVGIPERALTYAFVAGLPEDVHHTISAGSRDEGLDLTSVVAQAPAVLSDVRTVAVGVLSRGCSPVMQKGQSSTPSPAQALTLPSRGPLWPRCCWNCG